MSDTEDTGWEQTADLLQASGQEDHHGSYAIRPSDIRFSAEAGDVQEHGAVPAKVN